MFYFLKALLKHTFPIIRTPVDKSDVAPHTHDHLIGWAGRFVFMFDHDFLRSQVGTFNFHGWWIFFLFSLPSSLGSCNYLLWLTVQTKYAENGASSKRNGRSIKIGNTSIWNVPCIHQYNILTEMAKATKQKVNAHTHTYLTDFCRKMLNWTWKLDFVKWK